MGDGEAIPDFCPFVIERLEKVLKVIDEGSIGTIPKKFINQIERKQKDDPNPKFYADHGWGHVRRVTAIGKDFLESCVGYGYSSSNTVLKEKFLLEIAALMHDIGLADSARNHEIHSAELAKKYLSGPKVDIDLEDACTIVHAIYNHSKGDETQTIIDAALILADKLDVAKERIIRPEDEITKELLKVHATGFRFHGKLGKAKSAELWYETDEGFNALALRDWPKAVSIPYRITTEFLGLSEFMFTINGRQIDFKGIIS